MADGTTGETTFPNRIANRERWSYSWFDDGRNPSSLSSVSSVRLEHSGGDDQQSSLDNPGTDSDFCHRFGTQTSLSKSDSRYHPQHRLTTLPIVLRLTAIVSPHRNRRTDHVYTGRSTF
jgi:hypothetical protein